MSKIVLAVLAAAAFLYGLWIVLLGRPLPDLSRASGLRRRFLLAATLFAALLSVVSCREVGQDPMCYRLPLQPTRVEIPTTNAVVTTLQAVWRTLDEKEGAQFQRQLASLASRGLVKDSVTNVLSLAFAEVAYHRGRTRGTLKSPGPPA